MLMIAVAAGLDGATCHVSGRRDASQSVRQGRAEKMEHPHLRLQQHQRSTMRASLALSLLVSIPLALAATETYTLLDRTTSLSSGPTEWSVRGGVSIEASALNGYPEVAYQQKKKAVDNWQKRQRSDLPPGLRDESWYQLALVPGNGAVVDTDLGNVKGQVVSVKEVSRSSTNALRVCF